MAVELISVAAARERVLAAVHPMEPEDLPVSDSLGRVLAADVSAAAEVPAFPSSAMDGYAVQAGPEGRALTVVGESRAGRPSSIPLQTGQAIRISTGAALPPGADAVIRQEDVSEHGAGVRTEADVSPGANIRGAGEVMRRGQLVLPAGVVVGPAELGAAVAAGVAEVLARPQPRARVLTTGDELREPGAALRPGQIHNSNGPMLVAYARQEGATAPGALLLGDELAATEHGLAGALEEADLVIISGGVSVGPHDHVKQALSNLGMEEVFWGVALQPGKPTWFGVRGEKLVFGLPGNPVSAAVTFALFVAPALRGLLGLDPDPGGPTQAELAGDPVRRNRNREQALRVRLEQRDGTTIAWVNGPQGSHVITSLVGAEALALIPRGDEEIEPGSVVALQPLARYTLSP